jgi:UDP-N-acetyl-D-glucosamine dehydrogenase
MASQKLVVVGQGYVGLPLALRAAEAGYRVVGLDIDKRRVKRLMDGDSYVGDVSSGRLAAALDSGRFAPTDDYADAAGFDICVISVPTPLCDGTPDLTFVTEATRSVAAHVRPGCTVILESTTYPGTTDDLVASLIEEVSGLRAPGDYHLGYSPERTDPGNLRWRIDNTPKIVSGVDGASLEKVREFYGSFVEQTVPVSSPRTAELAKLLENTFRHVNIALVNELAVAAARMGTDIWEAIDAAATKPFGFMRFLPGPGVGGHCLPIDPSYLAWHVKRTSGQAFRCVEVANDINNRMPGYIVSRVIDALNERGKPLNDARVLLLGLSYKPDAGDVRESPSLVIAESLLSKGVRLRAVEPFADSYLIPFEIPLVELTPHEVAESDAVIILTDHSVFDYEMVQNVGTYVFDARNRCRGHNVETL